MKLNRKWLLVIALVLSLAMTTAGTLAYLTDRDSAVNTFTVGDVSIELIEEFEQGSQLIPGVDIEKEAKIKNTGTNDAWVWLTVLLPEEMGPYTAPDNMSASNNVVHWNYPKESAANITVDFNSTPVKVDTDGDGVTESYYRTNMLWKNALEPDETTGVMLSKVYMDTRVDIDPEGNMFWVVNGEATPIDWNINENGSPKIHVSAYAIQTEGFANVEAAYAAYQTQWGSNGAGNEYGTPSEYVTVSDLAELKAALEEAATNNTPVVIDAQNENLGDLDDVTFSDGTVIRNAVFTGDASLGSYGNNANGTVTFIDCTFDSEYAYAAHFDGGDGHLIFKDCEFYGWNSFGTAIESLTFENCTFGSNGTYGIVRAYQNATYTNCTFNFSDADNDGVDVHQLCEVGTVITLNNCTFSSGTYTDWLHFNHSSASDTAKGRATFVVDGTDVSDSVNEW